jgi:hypothetical protein
MTPPMRKMQLDSLPPPPKSREGGHHRKGEGILSYAQNVWSKGPKTESKIPVWYPGVYGVPQRLLRKPTCNSTSQEKALGLIVRMNHILDYPYLYGMGPHQHFFCLPARRLRVYVRSCGPIFQGDRGSGYTPAFAMNTSFATSNDYNWKRALGCTLRNFVHFLWVLKNPEVAYHRHSGSLS